MQIFLAGRGSTRGPRRSKNRNGFYNSASKVREEKRWQTSKYPPLESFPQFQFRELRILLRGSNNCLGHTYFYPIGFPLQFTHISFKFSLFTNSFANNCLHFSHIQYQVEFHFFCNLSLIFCNSAQNSWPFQTLLRSTDRKQKSICSQTLVKRKYEVRNSSSIFDS